MKVGIIGFGVVGKAVANTLSDKYEIIKFDKYNTYNDFEDLLSCDFIFITVPTPFDFDRYIVDDSAITESLTNLEKMNYGNVVIIKSTVPPGSCSDYAKEYNLELAFNPEFLRESQTPNEDFAQQHTVVIGVDKENVFEKIKAMYNNVLASDCSYHKVTYEAAELIKYSQNMTLASRVSISNIVYDACLKYGVDYSTLKKIAFDSFDILGPNMTQVPGPDGQRGFGGKCLPKDILGFNSVYKSPLIDAIIDYNNNLREDIPKKDAK